MENTIKLNKLYKERVSLLNDIKTLNNMLSETKLKLVKVTNEISILETVDDVG